MLALIYRSLNFLQLRGSPADLPHRPGLLLQLLVVDIALTALLYHLLKQSDAWIKALLSDALHLMTLAGVLWLRSRSTRLVQTATAVFGVGFLLGLLTLPPILVLVLSGVDLSQGLADGVSTQAASGFLQLVLMTLLVWRLLAEGQLLRHALDLPYFAAVTIALVMTIGEVWILQALFPPPTP